MKTLILFAVGAFCVINLVQAQENEYQKVAHDLHNQLRRKHRADDLRASGDLNRRAVKCAQHYANKGKIDHSCPHKHGAGENLWAMWGGSPSDNTAAKDATNNWYSEISKHNYNGDFQPASGHFTQLVWKNSRDFGFGIARVGSMTVGCGLYSPHGNVRGHFKQNVLRP